MLFYIIFKEGKGKFLEVPSIEKNKGCPQAKLDFCELHPFLNNIMEVILFFLLPQIVFFLTFLFSFKHWNFLGGGKRAN